MRTNNFPRRMPQSRLPGMMVATWQVSAIGRGHWNRRLFPIPIAPQGQGHTQRGSADGRSEQLGPATSDPLPAKKEHEDQGLGIQLSEAAPERTSGSDQDDGDAGDLVRSGRPRGKSWRSVYTSTVRIDPHQLRIGARLTGLSGVPHSWSISPRGQLKYLGPSKPSWNPSPSSMPNTRSVLMLRSRSPSDNWIFRTLLL